MDVCDFQPSLDLDRFVEKGTTYNRGYLLCGPTGTGKSSLVAAMANYLKADVCDLDLSQVSSSSQLQTLLMETTNTSILLVEDIVCLPEFMKRSFKQVDETKVPIPTPFKVLLKPFSSINSLKK